MRPLLTLIFSAILIGMLAITTLAMKDRSVLAVGADMLADPWYQATLCDAYFGFLTFYVWVAYKERSIVGRGVWLVLIMTLGNIAMSVYVLWRLLQLKPGDGARELLLRSPE